MGSSQSICCCFSTTLLSHFRTNYVPALLLMMVITMTQWYCMNDDDDVVTLQDVSILCSLLQLWEGRPHLQRLQGPPQGAWAAVLQLRRMWSHGSWLQHTWAKVLLLRPLRTHPEMLREGQMLQVRLEPSSLFDLAFSLLAGSDRLAVQHTL